jgi:hypothetical protein
MRPRIVTLTAATLLLFLVTACGGSGGGGALAVGDAAPAFSLPSADGRTVSLSEFRGKQALLLYFSMGPG